MARLFTLWVVGFCLIGSQTMAWTDPSYGTGDPPNYKKKSHSNESPYVYSSRFNDPYNGTSNPPGYNERKAKEMGKIYVPPKAEPLPPVYGTGVRKKSSRRWSR